MRVRATKVGVPTRLPKRPSEGRGWFRGVRRWLVLSVVGVAFVAVTIVLRAVTPGPRNDYDILFSLERS